MPLLLPFGSLSPHTLTYTLVKIYAPRFKCFENSFMSVIIIWFFVCFSDSKRERSENKLV